MPVDPISRAKFRLALNEIEHYWYPKYTESYADEVLDMKFVDEIKNYLLEDDELTEEEAFDLYYEERERRKRIFH